MLSAAVCIQSCRPNSESNRYFFSPPTAAFFSFPGADLNIIDGAACLQPRKGICQGEQKHKLGGISQTSQVIRNSSSTLKKHTCAREGTPTGAINHTRTPPPPDYGVKRTINTTRSLSQSGLLPHQSPGLWPNQI